jgi:hypothetical protein
MELKITSYNDLIRELNAIADDVHTQTRIVTNLMASMSSSRIVSVSAEITHTVGKSGGREIKHADGRVKLLDFEAPNEKVLAKHFSVIARLETDIQRLEAVREIAKKDFHDLASLQSFLAASEKLIEEAHESIDNAYRTLAKIAKDHAPKAMLKMAKAIEADLDTRIPSDNYTSKIRKVVVYPDTDGTIDFASYLGFRNMMIESTDTENPNRYHEYYVILTGNVDKTGMLRYHITTSVGYEKPGTYRLGKIVSTAQEAVKEIMRHLSVDRIMSVIDRKPLPENLNVSVLSKLPKVTGVKVEDDFLKIGVHISANDEEQHAILGKAFAIIREILGQKVKMSQRQRVIPGKGTIYYVSLNVPASATEDKLAQSNAEKVERLREELGLGDSDVRELKKMLWK